MLQESNLAKLVALAPGSAHANAAAMVICKPRCPISRATTHKDILKPLARMRTLCSAIVEASSSQNCVWEDAKPLAFLAVR